MRIQSAMLCEAASIENGKLFVLGASLATWLVPGFPGTAAPVLVAIVEADRDIDLGEARFIIQVSAAGSQELLRAEAVVQIHGPADPGVPWILPVMMPLQISVPQPTLVDVTIGTEAGIEARIPLMVMLRPEV
jgi:hypothetical protein